MDPTPITPGNQTSEWRAVLVALLTVPGIGAALLAFKDALLVRPWPFVALAGILAALALGYAGLRTWLKVRGIAVGLALLLLAAPALADGPVDTGADVCHGDSCGRGPSNDGQPLLLSPDRLLRETAAPGTAGIADRGFLLALADDPPTLPPTRGPTIALDTPPPAALDPRVPLCPPASPPPAFCETPTGRWVCIVSAVGGFLVSGAGAAASLAASWPK